jgi:uncharacterized membrane protein YkvA (DUF1232 family)
MASKNPSPRSVRDLAGMFRELRLAWRLFRDGRVSPFVKSVPLLAAAYLIWPLDLLPDLALGLGQLDDLAVIALGVRLFTALCPRQLVQEHLRLLAGAPLAEQGETIDTTYRVLDEE